MLVLTLTSAVAAQEPVDNCATLLGSLSVELRHARALPPGARTTFTCPRYTQVLLGASKQRITNSLGAPDLAGGAPQHESEGGPGMDTRTTAVWSYFFTSAHSERSARVPELMLSFNDRQQVVFIDCQLSR